MLLCVLVECLRAQDTAALRADVAALQEQIKVAEAENAKYTGGLVKSLIASRLEILRQTEAMLQQRLKASTYGISLRYMVDGKPFLPSDSTNELLRAVEQEIADNQVKITRQEAEVARYRGGLVQAMSLSTLETLKQTQSMLEQRRLALKYNLPQYVGFQAQTGIAPVPNNQPQSTAAPVAAPANEKEWQIVSVDSRVTESNDVWSRFAWKLTLRNDSDQPKAFRGTIEFQDSYGFIVDTSNVNTVMIPAKSEQELTGFALIRAEVRNKVARTVAKIAKAR
jgi:hypothetical protein